MKLLVCDAPECDVQARPGRAWGWRTVHVVPPKDGHHLRGVSLGGNVISHANLLGGYERWFAESDLDFHACSRDCLIAILKALPAGAMVSHLSGEQIRPAVLGGLLAVPDATVPEEAETEP